MSNNTYKMKCCFIWQSTEKKQEKAGDHSGQAVELCLRENCSSCLRQFIKQLLYDTQPLLISITWARFPSSILA